MYLGEFANMKNEIAEAAGEAMLEVEMMPEANLLELKIRS